MSIKSIILASASLWRKRLLRKHNIPCRIHVSDFVEVKRHVSPEKLVKLNAEGKAKKVAERYKNALVLGVDTIGVVGRKILGKPETREGAGRMVMMLSGKTHRVISGVCLIDTATGKKRTAVATTKVTFKKITPQELKRYLDSNHWKGKAGAYAIQGRAKGFVEKIDGDITNVIGVPIAVVKKMLRQAESRLELRRRCRAPARCRCQADATRPDVTSGRLG